MEINAKTRVIAKRYSGELLATNDENVTINDIFEKACIINNDGEILSPELPIGVFLKQGYWEMVNYNFYDKKINDKSDKCK